MNKKCCQPSVLGCLTALTFFVLFATTSFAELPNPGMEIDMERTAPVVTDPQNDFLNPKGVTWRVVGKSVTDNNTVENIETLLKSAKNSHIPMFVSPHYYYPHDHSWKFEGALEKLMHKIGMFDRKSTLNIEGFEGLVLIGYSSINHTSKMVRQR